MKAMILAAGEGTRLRPLTLTLPKPMVPIVGKPLLQRTLLWLAEQGITEAAINLYHRPQAIPDHFGGMFAGIILHYFFEDTLRGTAGGVKAAAPLFQKDPFFVIYGDNLIQADLRRIARFHVSHAGVGTITLFHHPNPAAAGMVGIDETGRINRFVEKPPADQVFSGLANAGIYLLDPAVLDVIPGNVPADFGKDIFPAMLATDRPLYGMPLEGYLQDTGTPDGYRQANWDLLAGKTGVHFGNPRLWIAPSAQVGRDVSFVGRNIIGEGVVIGDGAVLTESIFWSGAQVASGEHILNTIRTVDVALQIPQAQQEVQVL